MSDGFDTGVHDFANDGTALVYRQLKVEALRTWLWCHHVTAADVREAVAGDQNHVLNRICRDVGVNAPSKGSPTWAMVIADLEAREAWAATLDPADPRIARPDERPTYLPTGVS